MTDYLVGSSTTSIGLSLVPGDQLSVGGTSAIALDTTDVHAIAQIASGGLMSDTTLQNSASLTIGSGGSANSGAVDSTSELRVQSGGSLSNFTVSGLLELDHGGIVSQVVIAQGGVARVSTLENSVQVAAGGTEEVFLGGTDQQGTVAGVQLLLGGEAAGDKILAGGLQEVGADGIVEAGVVQRGGSVVVSRFGGLTNTALSAGSIMAVFGEASSNTIGGAVTVLSGGLGSASFIQSGGSETISSGGESQSDVVQLGGLLTVLTGGAASRSVVAGEEVLGSGAADLSGFVVGGGLELVSGGTANLGVVGSGGKLQAVTGGVVSSAVVSSGGVLTVSAGGLAAATDLKSGASAAVMSGGVASGGLVDSGATETVFAGGQEAGETVIGVLSVRGSATGDDVANGGQIVALSGGVIISAITNFDGEDLISNGGTARATRIAGSGTEVVLSGGVASGTTVFGGGQEVVASGGAALQLTVSSAGSVDVAAGGKIQGLGLDLVATLFDSGRVLLGDRNLKGILFGAGVIAETASNGLLVMSTDGGGFGGRAVISGGRIELAVSGAIGSGQVAFLGGAVVSQTLQIDASAAPAAGATFANTISNFNTANKAIDLRGLAFRAGAGATLSGGVLTLHDGGKSFRFNLGGFVGKSFTVAADGSGGTEITAHNTARVHPGRRDAGRPGTRAAISRQRLCGRSRFPISRGDSGGRD